MKTANGLKLLENEFFQLMFVGKGKMTKPCGFLTSFVRPKVLNKFICICTLDFIQDTIFIFTCRFSLLL